MSIGDDGELAVHRAMIEIEEALRLAIAHHIAAVWIAARDLGLLHLRPAFLVLQGLLAVQLAFGLDRRIQIGPIVGARLLDHRKIVFALVGIGLQMGRIRVKHRAVDQPVADRLLDDVIEDVLGNRCIVVTAAAVLAERRGVEHSIRQLQLQKPAIGDIDFDLAHQLPLRADAIEIAEEQRLEHQGRVERRAAVVGAVKSRNTIMNERKVDHSVDLAKQVILRHQAVERHHLESRLLRRGFLQHVPLNHKPPAKARGLSAI